MASLILCADPYLNDVNFVLSVVTLEELGATGNKGLAGILINPVHANAVSGLATSGATVRLPSATWLQLNVQSCTCPDARRVDRGCSVCCSAAAPARYVAKYGSVSLPGERVHAMLRAVRGCCNSHGASDCGAVSVVADALQNRSAVQ